MLQILQKFFNWLVLSSADPTQASATVKGILGGVATTILVVSPLLHLHIGSDQLSNTVDLLVQIFTAALGIVSAVTFILGAIRKVYLTWFDKSSPA